MKLPGDANAVVSKLRDYCLDRHHPRGRHKARVFLSALGLEQTDAEFLRTAILEAARQEDAVAGEADEYGDRYTVDFQFAMGSRQAWVRSCVDHSAEPISATADQLFCTIGKRCAMRELELPSVVALFEDVADHNLLCGQVGTVVERLAAGVYEIEFSDDEGRAYALLSLRADQSLQLHHEPSHRAA